MFFLFQSMDLHGGMTVTLEPSRKANITYLFTNLVKFEKHYLIMKFMKWIPSSLKSFLWRFFNFSILWTELVIACFICGTKKANLLTQYASIRFMERKTTKHCWDLFTVRKFAFGQWNIIMMYFNLTYIIDSFVGGQNNTKKCETVDLVMYCVIYTINHT